MSRFCLGLSKSSDQVRQAMRNGLDLHHYISRHLAGDWRELPQPMRESNLIALRERGKVTSVFPLDTKKGISLQTNIATLRTQIQIVHH